MRAGLGGLTGVGSGNLMHRARPGGVKGGGMGWGLGGWEGLGW
jgi:hypothetical protein